MIGRRFLYAGPRLKKWVEEGGTAASTASLSCGQVPARDLTTAAANATTTPGARAKKKEVAR
jgi:hypothetical protein